MKSSWLSEQVKKRRYKLGVEIGVKRGENLFHLLEQNPALHMVGVDPWAPVDGVGDPLFSYSEWDHSENYQTAMQNAGPYLGRVVLVAKTSAEAVQEFEPESIDFVFIDGCHTYQHVKHDIVMWAPKVRAGGLVCGHDINWPSVQRAVFERNPLYQTHEPERVWFWRVV